MLGDEVFEVSQTNSAAVALAIKHIWLTSVKAMTTRIVQTEKSFFILQVLLDFWPMQRCFFLSPFTSEVGEAVPEIPLIAWLSLS